MNSQKRYYAAIDLKSFYASVECRERGLDPLTANLVVADEERTEKTICLAVSPSLKALGIPGRARLFEVISKVKVANKKREKGLQNGFTGKSYLSYVLEENPSLAIDFLIARPRMNLYMTYSAMVYQIYLKYLAPEDIHVYSIDEVLLDLTTYLEAYHRTPRDIVGSIMEDIYQEMGLTATAGIGTNLYLCKVAMDIMAKHVDPDEKGRRIAELDERSYKEKLWSHRPLTDFWRIGPGYARKLEKHGMRTMGDVARVSLTHEDLLYDLFGVNAELLIDHAWGIEPCTMEAIKAYEPEEKSISRGQVLPCPYGFEQGRLIVQEMADLLSLDLLKKKLLTDQVVLTVCYDIENLKEGSSYEGKVKKDRYGRKVPDHAHGTGHLSSPSSSTREVVAAALKLYDKLVDKRLTIRRVYISAEKLRTEEEVPKKAAPAFEQLDLFTDYEAREKERKAREEEEKKERKAQEAALLVQRKFGKNALLKGMNLQEGGTTRARNETVGGHRG